MGCLCIYKAESHHVGQCSRRGWGEVAAAGREAEVFALGIVEHGAIALVLHDVARVDHGGRQDAGQVAVCVDVLVGIGGCEVHRSADGAAVAIFGIDDVGCACRDAAGSGQFEALRFGIDRHALVGFHACGQCGIEGQDESAYLVGCTDVERQGALGWNACGEGAATEIGWHVLLSTFFHDQSDARYGDNRLGGEGELGRIEFNIDTEKGA